MYLKTRVWDVHKRKVVSPWDIVICACSGSYGIAHSYEPPEKAKAEEACKYKSGKNKGKNKVIDCSTDWGKQAMRYFDVSEYDHADGDLIDGRYELQVRVKGKWERLNLYHHTESDKKIKDNEEWDRRRIYNYKTHGWEIQGRKWKIVDRRNHSKIIKIVDVQPCTTGERPYDCDCKKYKCISFFDKKVKVK